MGDYRIVIEAVGGHGCGRETPAGGVVQRCKNPGCPDCLATALVQDLMRTGNTIRKAALEHWPTADPPGPVDDLLNGTRQGSFVKP